MNQIFVAGTHISYLKSNYHLTNNQANVCMGGVGVYECSPYRVRSSQVPNFQELANDTSRKRITNFRNSPNWLNVFIINFKVWVIRATCKLITNDIMTSGEVMELAT